MKNLGPFLERARAMMINLILNLTQTAFLLNLDPLTPTKEGRSVFVINARNRAVQYTC
jgi:hypothetical protein